MCNCTLCQLEKYPYTSLETFRRNVGVDPWTFWGWDSDKLHTKGKGACYSVVRQSSNSVGCESNTLGRENILDALRLAEQTYRDYIGTVVPEWHTKQIDGFKWHHPRHLHGHNKVVLPHRNIVAVGKEVRTTLATVDRGTAGYALQSLHGAVIDTFVLTVTGLASTVTTGQIKLYIAKPERTIDDDSYRRWEIPFDSAEINAGTLTIKGKSYLLAKPELYEWQAPFSSPQSFYSDYSLDPDYLDNYVSQLEVVQVTVDNCLGSTAQHRNRCGCPTCTQGNPTCTYCTDIAFCLDDVKAGIVSPIWNTGALCHGHPDKFCVTYQTEGLSCDRDWSRDISILAIANMQSGICRCSYVSVERWYEDLAKAEKHKSTAAMLDNPIGTRAGHVYAWNVIKQFKNRGVLAW